MERNGGALSQVHVVTLIVSHEGIAVVSPQSRPAIFRSGKALFRNQTENHTRKTMRFWGVEARFGVYNSKIGFPITYETEERSDLRKVILNPHS